MRALRRIRAFFLRDQLSPIEWWLNNVKFCDSCGSPLKAIASSHGAVYNKFTGKPERYGLKLVCIRHPGGPSHHFYKMFHVRINPVTLDWLREKNIYNAEEIIEKYG